MQNQTNQQSTPNTQTKQITWETTEFIEHKKSPMWFIGLAAIMAIFILYAIFSNSWSMAIVFSLIGIMTLVYGNQKPKTVTIRIDGTGVSINNSRYEYKVINKFWIVYYPPEVKVLYLETGAYLNNLIRIELDKQDPLAVKEILSQYLEEDLDGKETLVDTLARKLKF